MTNTAVAYSVGPEWVEPRTVKRWPGAFGVVNRVATQITYDKEGQISGWGMKCLLGDTIESQFKLYLDPAFVDPHPEAPTHERAVQFYLDYMKCLLQCLEELFEHRIKDWEYINVEYVFSIPTSWANPSITTKLEKLLASASSKSPSNRRFNITLTEAEAAAISVAGRKLEEGDVIMVIDAGGSTTDLNILKLVEVGPGYTLFQQLSNIEGINVSSTGIDHRIHKVLIERLQALQTELSDDDAYRKTEDMMRLCNFEHFKCVFDGGPYTLDWYARVPESLLLQPIKSTRIVIRKEELQAAFDEQLERLFDVIDKQILSLTKDTSIKYIALLGGLGSSAYVSAQIKTQYPSTVVLGADEPDLTVAYGLVLDRLERLRRDAAIELGNYSGVSYGIICRRPYDPKIHADDLVTRNPLDYKLWVEDQID